MRAIVGVDVGGTFTDVALIAGGRLTTAKVPTTTDDQSRGVVEGVALALAEAGLEAGDVARLGHGTTVATNALLERRGVRTALVATAGFGDLLTLARQTRPHLYRLEVAPPEPLASVTAEVDERTRPRRRPPAARPRNRSRRRRAASAGRAPRPSPCACSTPTPTHGTSARWPAGCGAPFRASTWSRRSTSRPSSASTSGRRPRSPTPTSARSRAGTWGGSGGRPRSAACPSRT